MLMSMSMIRLTNERIFVNMEHILDFIQETIRDNKVVDSHTSVILIAKPSVLGGSRVSGTEYVG